MRLPRLRSYPPSGTAISLAVATVVCASVACLCQEAAPAGSATIGGTLSAKTLGQDFAEYEWIVPISNPDGDVVFRTNQFRVLENNLNYLNNGAWQKSDDVIESFQNGAVARHGANQAIFSNDLNVDTVFDVLTSDGKRIAGEVRAIQLADSASGKSLVLGTVRQSVPAQLLAPSQILYADAFDGIDADVLLTWRHNLFSHDILAGAAYKPKGYAFDFIMLPDSPLTTSFTPEQTYWITNNYYYGGSVT